MFTEYLRKIHADQYQGLDDDMPDDFDRWLCELSVDDIVNYANSFGKQVEQFKKLKELSIISYTIMSSIKRFREKLRDVSLDVDYATEFLNEITGCALPEIQDIKNELEIYLHSDDNNCKGGGIQ